MTKKDSSTINDKVQKAIGERTMVIIKPDGVQRSLIGEIIKRYEQVGLKLIACKMLIASPELATKHYYEVGGEEWLEMVGKKASEAYAKKGLQSPYKTFRENGWAILQSNAKYLCSGPIIAMIWQGNQAVQLVRKITGSTEPLSSDIGTIRGDYSIDTYQLADIDQRSIRNLIHASGTTEEAEKEIKIWFEPKEITNYRTAIEHILYDADWSGSESE